MTPFTIVFPIPSFCRQSRLQKTAVLREGVFLTPTLHTLHTLHCPLNTPYTENEEKHEQAAIVERALLEQVMNGQLNLMDLLSDNPAAKGLLTSKCKGSICTTKSLILHLKIY